VIREYVTINKGTEFSGTTKIGDNSMLMAYVHIAHDCVIGKHVILANNVNLAGHVEVDDWAILGGSVNVQQFTKIGKHAFISGGGGVNKDVPPYVKAARFPLSYIGVNSVGMRRRGFDSKTINSILEIYRILFVRGYNTSNALKLIEAEIEDSMEKDEITTFVRNSVRGIMKGFGAAEKR
jgi:UDP-N-acetylglucosamine acyltransferase